MNEAGEVTVHTYVRTEEKTEEGQRTGFAFMFRCSKSGTIRQYGLVGLQEIRDAAKGMSKDDYRAQSRLLGAPKVKPEEQALVQALGEIRYEEIKAEEGPADVSAPSIYPEGDPAAQRPSCCSSCANAGICLCPLETPGGL
jgi:hypothetical protein